MGRYGKHPWKLKMTNSNRTFQLSLLQSVMNVMQGMEWLENCHWALLHNRVCLLVLRSLHEPFSIEARNSSVFVAAWGHTTFVDLVNSTMLQQRCCPWAACPWIMDLLVLISTIIKWRIEQITAPRIVLQNFHIKSTDHLGRSQLKRSHRVHQCGHCKTFFTTMTVHSRCWSMQ